MIQAWTSNVENNTFYKKDAIISIKYINWGTRIMIVEKRQLLISLILFLILIAACSDNSQEMNNETIPYPEIEENPIVTITMEDDQEIIIELFPDIAPNTVANFISLIEDGFYDGLVFHRVIPEFMIQGGDPQGNGLGGPDYSIAGEFSENMFENNLSHDRGVISMARTQSPNSAGSQFFIVQKKSTHLDGQYAAFGQVIEGMDVVDHIANLKRDSDDKPLVEYAMKSVTVDTKGVKYPDPIKQ